MRNFQKFAARKLARLLAALALASSQAAAQSPSVTKPPQTRREPLVETLHGAQVPDPYRWLEDGNSPEVRAWTDAQNAHARRVLDAIPGRAAVSQRLSQLLAVGTLTAPVPRGSRYFYTRREGAQGQPVLYVREGLSGPDRALVDPNKPSAEGANALDWWYASRGGERVAYGLSDGGGGQSTLYVVDAATGRSLPDKIANTRAPSVAWLPDASGFYYTRSPAPGSVPKGEENFHRRVFLHRLGDDPARDEEVYARETQPAHAPAVTISRDGRWLVLTVTRGPGRNDLYVRDLREPAGEFVPVAEGRDASYSAQIVGNRMYVLTTDGAPLGRIYESTPSNPNRAGWHELVPESDAPVESFAVTGDQLVVNYLDKAASRLRVFLRDGTLLRDLKLPAPGTSSPVSAREDGNEAFFAFSSFALPPVVYRYDALTGKAEEWARAAAPPADPKTFEVRQVTYQSKDGTYVTMFLAHRKGLKANGANPTLLTGYGGFGFPYTPAFNPAAYLWLERGGVYAVANLRGGGEYGEKWHRAGMLGQKQNVFDDFTAAAEYLVNAKITSPARLAVYGASNGGLLVAAALTQRPDLFRAAVCSVPLTDMLRYQRFGQGRLWVPEYGSADDPRQFQYLRAYSPYHRVAAGTKYPATLVTTADSDARHDPMHARKLAAALQSANASDAPVLLRTEIGPAAPNAFTKQLAEAADVWSFLFWELGVGP